MKLTQIKIECKPAQLDIVCAVVDVYEPHMQIEDASDVVEANPVYGELIDEELLQRRDEASVSIYIENDTAKAKEIETAIKEDLEKIGEKVNVVSVELNDEDWADNWKQYYKPIEIGKKLVIVPEWEDYALADGQVMVKMDPGMAFGTGTHESTQLVAELMEEYMLPGSLVLDVGTGSGILAIAAAKLGAKVANGYDIDPSAVKIAGENAILNECSDKVYFAVSDLLAQVNGVYNFCAANITADIVIRMAPDIARFLVPGGLLAVSGVVDERRDEVVDALEKGNMKLADERHKNGWSGLLFKA